MEVIAWD